MTLAYKYKYGTFVDELIGSAQEANDVKVVQNSEFKIGNRQREKYF